MRIAHITTVPITLKFMSGQIRLLGERGFDVHVISSPGPELEAFANAEGATPFAVEMPRSITPIHDFGVVARLVRYLRENHIEIVHAHTPKGGLLGMIAGALARAPVRIYHMHGMPYTSATGKRRALLKATERLSCRLAHRVICVSPSMREQAINDAVCDAGKILVLGAGSAGGVDATEKFNPDRISAGVRRRTRMQLGIGEGELIIGFVGRVVRDKGIHDLAAAWFAIRQERNDIHLVIAGPVEPQDPVNPEVMSALAADPCVHMLGFTENVHELYAIFDVFVLPTYREGFGQVNIEVAAMGVPVVSTNIPGCVDSVQDGVTGTLVPPRDEKALRDAIQRYLDDPSLRKRHGEAGRARALREFRQSDIWEAMLGQYTDLLTQRGLPVPGTAEVGTT